MFKSNKKDQFDYNYNQDSGRSIGLPEGTFKITGIIFLILAVAGAFYYASTFVKAVGSDEVITFEFHADIASGKIQRFSFDEEKIMLAAKNAQKIKFLFTGVNGNEMFNLTLKGTPEMSDLDSDKPTRRNHARKFINGPLVEAGSSYNKFCKNIPFRVFGLAIDITEGAPSFSFSKYLSKADFNWIKEDGNSAVINFFSFGFNPEPGFIQFELKSSWSQDERERRLVLWELKIERYMDGVGSLKESNLFSQYNWIFQKFEGFYGSQIYIFSDFLQNTRNLSAYRDDTSYKSFLKGENFKEISNFSLEKCNCELPKNIDGTLRIIRPDATVLGKSGKIKSWNSAVEKFIGIYSPSRKRLDIQWTSQTEFEDQE